jgi:hypothetical protein
MSNKHGLVDDSGYDDSNLKPPKPFEEESPFKSIGPLLCCLICLVGIVLAIVCVISCIDLVFGFGWFPTR